jgi:antitoxin ParD1/3/4
MANVEKISVALTPEMAGMIRTVVDGGDYVSTSEVVREALREWRQRRTLGRRDIDELRGIWTDGIGSGQGRFDDIAALKAEARCRFETMRNKG